MNTRKFLKQTAVYWGAPVPNGTGGYTFADPIDIPVRWEDKSELFVDAEGREARSQSMVYSDRDLALGGYLYLGALASLPANPADPMDVPTALQIRAFKKIPDLKAKTFLRLAVL